MTLTVKSEFVTGRRARRHVDLIRNSEVRCPCCDAIVAALPALLTIEPCRTCRRPLTLLRIVRRARAFRICNLIDLIGKAYGIATLFLVVTSVVFGMDAKTFAKAFTILLFVVGSHLLADGVLSIRTQIDRTLNVIRCGIVARMMGVGKTAAATIAFLLVTVGVTL